VLKYAGPEGSGTYQETTMSYDGYGRLQARHLPEQNVGSTTSWTYNSDGTINTITDARGAVSTYGYAGNNRGLVKTITHTLAGSPTVSVSYNYDAAGNRTTMTDPSGSVTYTYDQLSRLTLETRSFTGVGSYSINYAYNLAGALTSITDPFSASFTYQRDSAGRLKTVTGSPYAGFTNYVTDVGYRAWGAPKSVSYSDRNSTISYNGRLQPDQFRLTANGTGASIIRENYAYAGDGRLAALTDLDDTSGANPPATLRYLSRGYSYDQVGRVTSGYGTGGAGQGVPYNQSYSYDEFGNMKSRSAIYYSYNNNPFGSDTATYTNNRRNGWSYNAEGQVTASPSSSTDNARSLSYDAAGRMITSFESGSNITYSAAYDGDGQVVKETSATSSTTETSYIVRSTALRGEVLTRLDQSGNKKVTHVPAEGLLFATQRMISGYGADVLTTYRNPLGTTETNKAVYDPLGNYIPYQAWHDPRPAAGSYNSGSMAQLSASQANPESMAVGCIMDGLPTNCGRVMRAIGNGQAREVYVHGFALSAWMMELQASFLQVKTERKVPRKLPPTEIYYDDDGYPYPAYGLPPNNVIEVSVSYVIAPGMQLDFEQNSQHPQPLPTDLKGRVAKIVNNPKTDCAEFIKKLIGKLRKAFSDDPMDLFKRVENGRGFRLGNTGKYAGLAGITSGKREVTIRPVSSTTDPRLAEHQAYAYAVTALNELMHQAKNSGVYSDRDLAKGIAKLLSPDQLAAHLGRAVVA